MRRSARCATESDDLARALRRVGGLLLNRSRRAEMLASLLDLALKVSRTDVGVVLVRDGQGFSSHVELGLSREVVSGLRFLPEQESVVDRVLALRRAFVVDQASGPSILVPQPLQVRVKGLVVIPVFIAGELQALVCLASGEDTIEVNTQQLETLETIAAILSLAIENQCLREGAHRSPPVGWEPTLEDLAALLAGAAEGAVVSARDGRILHANPAACRLLGIKARGAGSWVPAGSAALGAAGARAAALREWLAERWRKGESGARLDVPSNVGPGLRVAIAPLADRAGPCGGGWLTFLESALDSEAAASVLASASEIREHLNKVQLGVELLSRPPSGGDPADVGAAPAAAEVGPVLARSLGALHRLCEDLEEVAESPVERPRRACVLEVPLRQAMELLRGEGWDLGWLSAPEGSLRWVVLCDPWRLRSSLARILCECRRCLEPGDIVRLSLESEAGRVRVVFELRPEAASAALPAEAAEADPSATPRAASAVGGSSGWRNGVRSLSQQGGAVRLEPLADDRVRLVVDLPLAPGFVEALPLRPPVAASAAIREAGR
jgi:PAS domain-containing protein